MTVKQLINRLQDFNEDSEVYFADYNEVNDELHYSNLSKFRNMAPLSVDKVDLVKTRFTHVILIY